MFVKLILISLCCSVFASYEYRCNQRLALLLMKRPAYEFSIKLLQMVAEDTDENFVFSPISTWLQLTALAEGATGRTFREIWKVTRHHRNRCLKKKFSETITQINKAMLLKHKSVIVMDKLLAVKKTYIRDVEKFYGIQVLLLDFNNGAASVAIVNKIIEQATGGVIDRVLYYDDFNSTVLLLSDANYFRTEWKIPFQYASTKTMPFYSSHGIVVGYVSMMNQKGYYNLLDFPHIGAKVLEIPCSNDGVSMLIFLPTTANWVGEIFYNLERTRLTSIFNLYKRSPPKLVNVSIPKFKQYTEVENLPELIYDMGITKLFSPKSAELNGISKFKMYASLMTQISYMEIDEKGLSAGVEFLAKNDTSIDFIANKPFLYLVVNRMTEFILYAGMYSNPNMF